MFLKTIIISNIDDKKLSLVTGADNIFRPWGDCLRSTYWGSTVETVTREPEVTLLLGYQWYFVLAVPF